MKPQHWVSEEVIHSLADSSRKRETARRWLGTAQHQFNTGTRGSISGAVLTGFLGPLFTAPLVGRILFPGLTAKISRTTRGLMAPPPITRPRIERADGVPPGPTEQGHGFTLEEMVNFTERLLRDIGLIKNFAPLIAILGHGSQCLNNPHESVYHCGACSGSAGSPNARAQATMLNDHRVRRELEKRGIQIPEQTYFLGGLHNTATASVRFFDLELIPGSHLQKLNEAMDSFKRVSVRDAQERCRRFQTAPLNISPREALRHVEGRSEDLSQTRPEYGNGNNAFCFVGRRGRVRGMFMDRRSFLMSYDAAQDDAESTILARILAAVIPVCESINLIIQNQWAQLAILDYKTNRIQRFVAGRFVDFQPSSTELRSFPSSFDYFRGQRGDLHFALVGAGTP